MFVGFDDVADGAHRLGHLDPDRADGGARSSGIAPEAKMECSTPSFTKLKAASMIPRTG